jgi:hypothetical protein
MVRNCSQYIFVMYVILYFRIIKSRRMRLAGHVAQMGEKRNAYTGWDIGGIAREKETTRKTKMYSGG